MAGSNLLIHLDTIDQNDLIYVERDMNFAQKVWHLPGRTFRI